MIDIINEDIVSVKDLDELGEISKRLFDNLLKLEVDFAPLKFNDYSEQIFFFCYLERDAFIGDEKFKYPISFYPNETLETLRLVAYLFNGSLKESKVQRINKKINEINTSIIIGHLNLNFEEEKSEYTITYRYGVSLKRDGDKMNHTELKDILFNLNYVVGQILDILDGEENRWIWDF